MDHYDITQIDITGYDAPVPNEFWTIGSDTLLVMLPGLGYTNQMPLMFYVHELAIARRWDVLQVNYDYRDMTGTTQEERVQRIATDCRAALKVALAEETYRRVVLAGKSLGTIAMTALVGSGISQDVTTIWLTPLIKWPDIWRAMAETATTSIVVIGTRDDHYDAAFLEDVRGKGAMVEVIDGGDHSLDVEDGVVASIGALRQVIGSLDKFLDR